MSQSLPRTPHRTSREKVPGLARKLSLMRLHFGGSVRWHAEIRVVAKRAGGGGDDWGARTPEEAEFISKDFEGKFRASEAALARANRKRKERADRLVQFLRTAFNVPSWDDIWKNMLQGAPKAPPTPTSHPIFMRDGTVKLIHGPRNSESDDAAKPKWLRALEERPFHIAILLFLAGIAAMAATLIWPKLANVLFVASVELLCASALWTLFEIVPYWKQCNALLKVIVSTCALLLLGGALLRALPSPGVTPVSSFHLVSLDVSATQKPGGTQFNGSISLVNDGGAADVKKLVAVLFGPTDPQIRSHDDLAGIVRNFTIRHENLLTGLKWVAVPSHQQISIHAQSRIIAREFVKRYWSGRAFLYVDIRIYERADRGYIFAQDICVLRTGTSPDVDFCPLGT